MDSRSNRTLYWAEQFIYEIRWLLYPFNVGLSIALVIYLIKYVQDIHHLVISASVTETEMIRVEILGLVDTAMVANLLVMIIQGSHQIFIRKFYSDPNDRPQWLDHIDSGRLKVKISMSIVGITLIQILKDFVNLDHVEWELVIHRMIIHAMCLASALAMAVIWKILAEPKHESQKSGDESEHAKNSTDNHAGHDLGVLQLQAENPTSSR